MHAIDERFKWPEGAQIIDGRMFEGHKLCVPTPIQKEWVRAMHEAQGHVGFLRMWKILEDHYEWGDKGVARNFARKVMRERDTCQACQRPRNRYGPIQHAPIPPAIMASVAIDIFSLPPTKYEGKSYDCVVICVDRHSGWLIAIPELQKGLTGPKVAKALLQKWDIVGIPARITTDQGPQFANAWWRTMCASLGIDHVYSQPYHHQANGRAEMAGQQVQEFLRKLQADEPGNWVERIPWVLRLIHDTPGETGLFPYEIIFGRERSLARVPYQPPPANVKMHNNFLREWRRMIAGLLKP